MLLTFVMPNYPLPAVGHCHSITFARQ